MKPYSILLILLWLSTTFTELWSIAYATNVLFVLKSLGAVVLFTLCMAGCLQLAWNRRLVRFTTPQWRMTYQATLALGAFAVLLKNFGEVLGVAMEPVPTGLMQIGMDFLPYLLFAIPVIILEHELSR